MKLPNAWASWVKQADLETCQSLGFTFYAGHNRLFRVNASGNFECSCPLQHFDRWANSTGARWEGVPKTEEEFLEAVEQLIEESNT